MALGGVTLAVLAAAVIGLPHSGPVPTYVGAGRGSVDGPEVKAAGGSVGHPRDVTHKEQAQMSTLRNSIQASVVAGATLIAASASAQAPAVQWKVSEGGNGHWYQRIGTPMSFNDAQGAAILRSAHLATCADAGEWGRVVGVAAALPQQELYFWVGLYQNQVVTDFAEPAGGWRWVDGTQVGFSAWLPGEPNNTHGVEDFGHGFVSSSGANGWNDTFGRASFVSVIEWSADCNSDGIVDYGQCHDGTLADFNGNNTPDCCERGDACVVGSYPVQWRL
jgi:hypothetical protein